MNLDVIIDGKTFRIEVPQDMLDEGESFFQKMDKDMNSGWQMGPEFVESPDVRQRCQVAANKLLVSVSAQNQLMVQLMAGYILKRLPGIRTVEIDTAGEMLNTEFGFDPDARHAAPRPFAPGPVPAGQAVNAAARADADISQVYKVGKSYRFAIFDHASGRWVESPFSSTEEEAQTLRATACAQLTQKFSRN